MEAPPPVSDEEQELSAAFDKLRIVVAWRESEHARRWKQGVWIGRGSVAAMAVVFIAMMALSQAFDLQAFTKLMQSKVNENAPGIIRLGQQSVEGLGPVYTAETEKTIPTFVKSLADDAAMEAGQLTEALKPLARSDPTAYVDASDVALAKALQAKFKKQLTPTEVPKQGVEVPNPSLEALALVKVLRARQIADASKDSESPLAGPFVVLNRMEKSMAEMGSPDQDIVSEKQAGEEIAQAAIERSNGHAPPPEPAKEAAVPAKGAK